MKKHVKSLTELHGEDLKKVLREAIALIPAESEYAAGKAFLNDFLDERMPEHMLRYLQIYCDRKDVRLTSHDRHKLRDVKPEMNRREWFVRIGRGIHWAGLGVGTFVALAGVGKTIGDGLLLFNYGDDAETLKSQKQKLDLWVPGWGPQVVLNGIEGIVLVEAIHQLLKRHHMKDRINELEHAMDFLVERLDIKPRTVVISRQNGV